MTEGNDVFIAARVSAPEQILKNILSTALAGKEQHFTRVNDTADRGAAAQHRVAPQHVLNAQRLFMRRSGCPFGPSLAVYTRCASVGIGAATAMKKARKLVNLEAWWFSLHGEIILRTAARS